MAAPPAGKSEPITDHRQLVEHLEEGCKPTEDWRIGTEHEKFVFKLDTLEPVPYEGDWGIGKFLDGLQRFGWQPVMENGNAIALTMNDCNISLEPGGQLELSGAPLENIHQTCDEVHTHLTQVKEVAGELGVGLVGTGFIPKWKRDDIKWMPKGRYKIMREYMPKVGSMGLDMMLRTCTVQVNLDFSSEADMARKMRVGMAMQPIATALFANSPFKEGKRADYMSLRSHVWTDVDNDRSGILPFVFDDDFGYESYVDYVLDTPMYFVYRDGAYIDASGQSFRDFMAGNLAALPGERATMGDWVDHTTTLFPEVRLKQFLEMRGADGERGAAAVGNAGGSDGDADDPHDEGHEGGGRPPAQRPPEGDAAGRRRRAEGPPAGRGRRPYGGAAGGAGGLPSLVGGNKRLGSPVAPCPRTHGSWFVEASFHTHPRSAPRPARRERRHCRWFRMR